MTEKRLFTVAEASEALSLSERTVRALIKDGELDSVRVGQRGGGIRVSAQALDDYVQRLAVRS